VSACGGNDGIGNCGLAHFGCASDFSFLCGGTMKTIPDCGRIGSRVAAEKITF
jgi:hypothetical protein